MNGRHRDFLHNLALGRWTNAVAAEQTLWAQYTVISVQGKAAAHRLDIILLSPFTTPAGTIFFLEKSRWNKKKLFLAHFLTKEQRISSFLKLFLRCE